eukprot:scaffold408_cov347-Pavlova_lutheri.AAC.28
MAMRFQRVGNGLLALARGIDPLTTLDLMAKEEIAKLMTWLPKPATKEIMESTLETGNLHAIRSTNTSSYRLVSLFTFALSTT